MEIDKQVRGITADTGADPAAKPAGKLRRHSRGLLAVGIFKYTKAVFFTAVGAGALHLVHKDVGDVLMRVIEAMRIDPESRFVGLLMDKVGLINVHELRRAGTLSILYAAVCLVEGTGLVLEKSWAEYFTVILTAMALPWEGYELVEKFSPYKVLLLVINLAVLLYLLWILKKKKAEDAAGQASAEAV